MSNHEPPDNHPQETLPSPGIPVVSTDDFLKRAGVNPAALMNYKVESFGETESRLRQEELEQKARLGKEETERNARLEKERLDDAHKRSMERYKFIVKEATVYIVGILLITALGTTSTFILFNGDSAQEAKTWAKSTLTAIATAVAGYVFGKSSSSKD